ncbi:uncharacterized protein LY79DRAFT_234916 [Colletotrichum navitas]|uniref:Uncharacterized protein n=1 Tax=Colletotrichum navitas TaxID=681940 RepID=A0AAD8PXL3_9PEZI|nr:uncharacterized protein LY79DRAFT_234916 [Colletotrichum navitas]KAK1589791.1 hypothetical protein LY79DRAFT_234916 [Colletotrichum navitas]
MLKQIIKIIKRTNASRKQTDSCGPRLSSPFHLNIAALSCPKTPVAMSANICRCLPQLPTGFRRRGSAFESRWIRPSFSNLPLRLHVTSLPPSSSLFQRLSKCLSHNWRWVRHQTRQADSGASKKKKKKKSPAHCRLPVGRDSFVPSLSLSLSLVFSACAISLRSKSAVQNRCHGLDLTITSGKVHQHGHPQQQKSNIPTSILFGCARRPGVNHEMPWSGKEVPCITGLQYRYVRVRDFDQVVREESSEVIFVSGWARCRISSKLGARHHSSGHQ